MLLDNGLGLLNYQNLGYHQWLFLGMYAPCEHSEIPAISGEADQVSTLNLMQSEIGWPQAPPKKEQFFFPLLNT
jgi:hypothetical protein